MSESGLYPVNELFSRQRLQHATGVPDDVLGYWLKEGLLVSLPAEQRKHRRFSFYQAHVAVVLDAMRRLGANISVLRAFAAAMQRGAEIASNLPELTRGQLQCATDLASRLDRYHAGAEVSVFTPEWEAWLLSGEKGLYRGEAHKIAESEEDVIAGVRITNHDLEYGPIPEVAQSLRGEDWRALNMHLDLLNEEFLGDRLPNLNWVWLAWLSDDGRPRILDGEDGNFSMHEAPPLSGFYISVSRLIRRLWRPVETEG